MKQLTLRGFDKELERRLQQLAEKEHLSLNKTVLMLLRRITGLDADSVTSNRVGRSLDEFIGVWSPDEQREFNATTRVFSEIDETMWK